MKMKKGSKIFVAGGTGMVGSAIIRKLESLNYRNLVSNYHSRKPGRDLQFEKMGCRFIKLNLKDKGKVEQFFNRERPEFVFLAAAKVGGILANSTYPAEFIYDNLMIAANVIHTAYEYKVKKLLNLGSSCIFPKSSPQPMKEEYLLTGELEKTNEPYAIAKIAAIKLCRYYNEQYGTNFISVMPSNLYGPNDNFNLKTSHVLPALIRKFYLAKLLSEGNEAEVIADIKRFPTGFGIDNEYQGVSFSDLVMGLNAIGISDKFVKLWGTGEAYREFLYVDDLADACVFLMNRYDYKEIGEFINIGTGEEIRLKNLAALIKEIVGFEGRIEHDRTMPDGMPKKLLDVSRIRSLGWNHRVPLAEGIKRTIQRYGGIERISQPKIKRNSSL